MIVPPNPVVTVLICTRDRVRLLAEAVESVWQQDAEASVRLLCIFDGPVPADLALPEPSRRNHALEVVRNAGTPGLAGARNFGLSLVQSELVALCDDDDRWLPGKLEAQLKTLHEHPGASCVGGGIRVRSGDHVVERRAPARTVRFDDLLRDRVMELHPSTFLMPTSRVREVGGWDESLPGGYAEDYDLLLRLARTAPIVMTDQVVGEILWAGQSFFFSRWAMIAAALQRLLAKFPEFAGNRSGRARLGGQIAFALASAGERRAAGRWIARTLRDNPREPRAALAGLVALRLVSPDTIQNRLHRHGRGI